MERAVWRRYLTGFLPVNLVQALVGFMGLAIYSRWMTPAAYGEYVLAVAAQMIAQWMLFGWILMSVARFTPRSHRNGTLPSLLSTAYLAGVVLTLLLLVVVAGLYYWWPEAVADSPLVLATLAFCLLRGLVLIGLESHRSHLQILRYSLLEMLQSISGLALGCYLVDQRQGQPEAAIFAMALANALVFLLDLRWIAAHCRWSALSGSMLAQFWHYGGPMMVVSALLACLSNLDSFLLALLDQTASVAAYGAANSIAGRPLAMAFVWIGGVSAAAGYNAMEKQSVQHATRVMSHAVNSLTLLTCPMVTGLSVLAYPITAVMLGSGLRDQAAALLPMVAVAGLLKGFMEHYFAQFFQLTTRTRALAMIVVFILLVNTLSNLWLIPRLGAMGAAISAVIAYGCGVMLQAGFAGRLMEIPWPGYGLVLKGLTSCALMYLVLSVLAVDNSVQGLIKGIVGGVVLYAASAWMLDMGGMRTALATAWRGRDGHGR